MNEYLRSAVEVRDIFKDAAAFIVEDCVEWLGKKLDKVTDVYPED